MARRYAQDTSVPVEKTRIEIEETLARFGADSFTSGYSGNTAFILFRARERFVKLVLEFPDRADPRFTMTAQHRRRTDTAAQAEWEKERRRLWRSLLLLVKAKLASVEDGIVEFEQEFLPHIVMPDQRTVFDHIRDPVALAYENGVSAPLLPAPGRS